MADEPKKTGKPHPKSLANLRPHPETLKRGGKQPRTALSIPELEYCSWRAQGADIVDAGRFAGIPASSLYGLEKRELVLETIEQMKAEFKVDAMDRTRRRAESLAVFVDGEYRTRLRRMKTHKYRGDDSIQRMLETGFRATGLIQPARTINQANAAAQGGSSSAQLYAKRLYLPDWRRETIEQLQNDERRESGVEVPNGTELPTGQ